MEVYQATYKDLDGVATLFNLYRIIYEKEADLKGAKSYI
ncbi:hypothetical protein A33I_09000 [Alkalihalophilus marmarensis DSM 21297]|uniref:GNAT family N-acetyltransferase n=1 Tax=Alkalihalophilus marmarensis DSM 21297 TaxID=1188261 RepID=U6SQK4_9BACI|nr:hypothetical protein A33I_09000 [Alkalihalophilus marmarensis DSM 21297]